jgi:hypothetical protein
MTTFKVDGKQVRVSIQPSVRARKTVEVEFRARDELVVTYPYGKDVDVVALLEKHRSLVKQKYREFLDRKKILDGDMIFMEGVPHRIIVKHVKESAVERVKIDDASLIINLKRGEKPEIILKGWLSQRTKELIDNILDGHQEDLGKPTRVFITDTARWGYCRKNGEIIFNWQLFCLSPELAEFVVIHELVHLSVLNHQNQFHNIMLKLLPDYQTREDELKKYISMECARDMFLEAPKHMRV